MRKTKTEWLTINDKRIYFQVNERQNKHKANSCNVVISDSKGHTLTLHGVQTSDLDEAFEIAVARYHRSPFPKENLLESLVKYHSEKQEDGGEPSPVRVGAMTFSVTVKKEEPEEEPQKTKRATFPERLERAKMAKELYEEDGATYKSVGKQLGVSPERIRQLVMFYHRSIRALETRAEPKSPPPLSGWEAIAARHGWL